MKSTAYDKHRPAKIGTIPMLVIVHGRDVPKIEPGKWVRVRYMERGPWEKVLVTKVDPDGHFFANR